MSNPWFRMYHEFAKDPAVQCLAFEDQRHYVVILCMKCDGTIDRPISKTNRDRMIYRGLGLDPSNAEEAKRRLMEMDLIDKDWQPKGWDKRQFKSDASTQRTRKYRKNNETGNVPGTSQERHCDAPEADTDTDTDTEEENINPNGLIFADGDPSAPAAAANEPSKEVGEPPPCPHQKIIDLYHEALPELRRVREWTKARQQYLQARWREEPERQSLDWWREFFAYLRRSEFLMGRTENPFRPDLEWIVRPSNFVKIIEGKYHERRSA